MTGKLEKQNPSNAVVGIPRMMRANLLIASLTVLFTREAIMLNIIYRFKQQESNCCGTNKGQYTCNTC